MVADELLMLYLVVGYGMVPNKLEPDRHKYTAAQFVDHQQAAQPLRRSQR